MLRNKIKKIVNLEKMNDLTVTKYKIHVGNIQKVEIY